jgi:hypothetical protein
MAAQQPIGDADTLLKQWLRERDHIQAHSFLESLIRHHAEPLIRRIVNFKLQSARDHAGGGGKCTEVDEVCSTALYTLLARLERIKSGDQEPAVRNFSGYAAVTAYNACNEYFRSRKPAWVSLSMKLRYLASHASEFGIWQIGEGQDVFGFSRHQGREASGDAAELNEACKKLWQQQDPARLSLSELVEAILNASRGPLVFETLVDVAAEWSGMKEIRVQSLDEDRGEQIHRWELADRQPPAEDRVRQRQYMEQLWTEICGLPLEHRKALLLNLEDSAGGDIQLFEFLGIATITQIAKALEMDPLEFAELWKRLPLDDISIGRELGLSRQDVANRRSSARKRLARKMREFEYGN